MIGTAALEVVAILVFEGHQVELTCPEVFCAEEAHGEGDAAVIDGVLVRDAEECRQALDDILRDGHVEVAAFVVGGREVGTQGNFVKVFTREALLT